MKAGGWILVGVGAVLFYENYKSGVNNLSFALGSFQDNGAGGYTVTIQVTNPGFWGYPVPPFVFNAYDASGTYLGQITSTALQYIGGNGVSYIYGTAAANFNNLVNVIGDLISSGKAASSIVLQGDFEVGPIQIPFNTKTGNVIQGYDPALNV